MPGVVTKKAILTNGVQMYRMGGFRLLWGVLRAKTGTPFLTVWMNTCHAHTIGGRRRPSRLYRV